MSSARREHEYSVRIQWTGNAGTGTSTYAAYAREHEISADGKATRIAASSTPHFRGDATRYNPEELLVAALSSCHMLWFLHLCAENGVVVEEYRDDASGIMRLDADGGGEFTSVTLRPSVRFNSNVAQERVASLHERAHGLCFIARSVNFMVACEPAQTPP